MTKQSDLIAVPELSISTGVITWWRLSGEVDLDLFSGAWLSASLDKKDLPAQASPTVALRRALDRLFVKADKSVGIHRIAPKNGSLGGFVVFRVSQEDVGEKVQDLSFSSQFKVWLEDDVVHVSCGKSSEKALRRTIWKAFQEELQKVDAHDLSSWLVRRVEAVGAVRLREGGGVYFVPETRVSEWRMIVSVLEDATESSIYEIPAMRSSRATSAILDALISETQQEVARMTSELDSDALGNRAIAARQQSCSALISKVSEYEKLLGTKVETLHTNLSVLQARLIEASMVSDS